MVAEVVALPIHQVGSPMVPERNVDLINPSSPCEHPPYAMMEWGHSQKGFRNLQVSDMGYEGPKDEHARTSHLLFRASPTNPKHQELLDLLFLLRTHASGSWIP